jgi:hypothetical protein
MNRNSRREIALRAWKTRRVKLAFAKAHAAEAASKEALREWCGKHGWRIAFFEGAMGAPRTGIIDAVIFRLHRQKADTIGIRLVQLKGGKSGISAPEVARLKNATIDALIGWMIAAYDGETLHFLPSEPEV